MRQRDAPSNAVVDLREVPVVVVQRDAVAEAIPNGVKQPHVGIGPRAKVAEHSVIGIEPVALGVWCEYPAERAQRWVLGGDLIRIELVEERSCLRGQLRAGGAVRQYDRDRILGISVASKTRAQAHILASGCFPGSEPLPHADRFWRLSSHCAMLRWLAAASNGLSIDARQRFQKPRVRPRGSACRGALVHGSG